MRHEIPGAAAWSVPVRAGRALTLTALEDGANATVLIIGADRLDRLNIPDTLKSQMSARIHAGLVLMSDRGLALATVLTSTLDWHDCLTGPLPDQLLRLELTKHGFGPADLHGCINFFSKVAISDDARASLTFVPNHAHACDSVTLRAEQDLLVFISTAPHPLSTADPAAKAAQLKTRDPAAQLEGPAVAVQVESADPAYPDLRAEAIRALDLTRELIA